MNDEVESGVTEGQATGAKPDGNFRHILQQSLFGTIGIMWVIGGAIAIFNLYDTHWTLGWIAAFVWVWGCWAAALYFDIMRFIR